MWRVCVTVAVVGNAMSFVVFFFLGGGLAAGLWAVLLSPVRFDLDWR